MEMRPEIIRLYEASEKLKGISTPTKLGRLLNVSPQTINGWEMRGISSAGLLAAEKLIGCSAVWLQTGQGEMIASKYHENLLVQSLPQEIQDVVNMMKSTDEEGMLRIKFCVSDTLSNYNSKYKESTTINNSELSPFLMKLSQIEDDYTKNELLNLLQAIHPNSREPIKS